VGDLIVLYSWKDGGTTVPVKPTASGTVPNWVGIDTANGANTCASGTYYFVATATNHTSGTWAGQSGMIAVVLTGHDPSNPIGGHAEQGATSSIGPLAPAVTLTNTDGSSVLLEFYGHRTVTAWSAAPTGYTRQVSVATEVCCNTKDSTTTDGSIQQPATCSNSGYRAATIEILSSFMGESFMGTTIGQAVNRAAVY
jgi:hypothetical protein